MGLYSVRVRLALDQAESRGGPTAEMVHHFEWADDDQAGGDFLRLVDAFTDSAIAKHWVCRRGDVPHHSLSLWRRSIESRRSWHYLGETYFALPEWETTSFGFDLGELSFQFNGREAPLWPDSRAAVLVRETSTNPAISRRLYVGPISPVPALGQLSVGLGGGQAPIPGAVSWFPNPNTLDPGFDPESDNLDRWRDKIRDMAAQHAAELDSRLQLGASVVPSWLHASTPGLHHCQGSSIRAVIRSRGQRGLMGPPFS